ncbi:hypothetical protein V1505DRAFT_377160, partial [Lipomyces doorenjongii]
MDSSSQSQNTQQRPPRGKRLDYHALNPGTDSEGDSDEGPRSRPRRRLEATQTSRIAKCRNRNNNNSLDILNI